MAEILNNIVSIKSFCMEKYYAKLVNASRMKEINMLRSSLYLRATVNSMSLLLKFSIFLCLVGALNTDNHLTASSAYVIISYYSMLFASMLQFWPLLVTHAKEAFCVVEKIQQLLLHPTDSNKINDNFRLTLKTSDKKSEICESISEEMLMSENVKMIRIMNEKFENANISLRNCVINKEELRCDFLDLDTKCYGVVGENGTKFIKLILGEIEFDSGEIFVNGSLSYVGRKPWIFSGNIRDNIIFTEVFDEERYSRVLKACALDEEIEKLPIGDETFLDDSIVNDSFKARISIARCIYRNAAIYFMDDCFEMMRNNSMRKNIFRSVLKEFMKVRKELFA